MTNTIKETNVNYPYIYGILMACIGENRDAKETIKIAEDWLTKHSFVPFGHKRRSNENQGFLFIHQKGKNDVITLLKYEDILSRNQIDENTLPKQWVEEGDLDNYSDFYKVTEVIWQFIPFESLEDRDGVPLKAGRGGNMYDLVKVRVSKSNITSSEAFKGSVKNKATEEWESVKKTDINRFIEIVKLVEPKLDMGIYHNGLEERSKFLKVFPLNELREKLTLETYSTGYSNNSFSNWVEKRTKNFATISGAPGQSAMFGVWSTKELIKERKFKRKEGVHNKTISYEEANKIFANIKEKIIHILECANKDEFEEIDSKEIIWPIFKTKIIFLYFPEKIISIMKADHIKKVCGVLGINFYPDKPIYSNYLTLKYFKKIPYFKDWSSWKLGALFYTDILDLKKSETSFPSIKTPKQKAEDLIKELDMKYSGKPEFEEIVVKQIKRPSELREAILIERGTECQICGYSGFPKKEGGTYAETHHMVELNKKAPMTLKSWNILVLCPLCHRKMHYADVESGYLGNKWKITLDGEDYIIK